MSTVALLLIFKLANLQKQFEFVLYLSNLSQISFAVSKQGIGQGLVLG